MHDFPESTFWGIMFFICEMEGLMIGKSAMQDGKRPEYIPPNIWPPCTIRLRTFQGESCALHNPCVCHWFDRQCVPVPFLPEESLSGSLLAMVNECCCIGEVFL